MQLSSLFNQAPMWLLSIFTVAVILLSVEVGNRFGSYRLRRNAREKDAPIGGLVGATLGLLAFILAFTFGASASRQDVRRQLVIEEANAIGTAYLRTDFLPEPQRTEARDTLVAFARLRSQGVEALLQPAVMAESDALRDRLWEITATMGDAEPQELIALYIEAVNHLIDTDGARIAAGRNQLPGSIWVVLYTLTIITTLAIGYQFGLTGAHSWPETVYLAIAFSLVIVLIADLDRPQRGFTTVSQQPLLDLLQQMTR